MLIINPPQARILESWKPFKDFFYEDDRGWVVPDIERIQSLAANYDFVLANCSTEHWGSERDFPLVATLHDLLAEHYAKNFVCLCHDPDDELHRPSILYFPFFAWWRAGWKFDPDAIKKTSRTYLVSNLNHNVRDFRIACYLSLKKKKYAEHCMITAYNKSASLDGYDGHFVLTDNEQTEWQNCKQHLPHRILDNHYPLGDLRHPALSDSYLHLITETTIKDKIFVTEKTWKPIAAGQLFMIWGNQGIVAHLRSLGVDVFDDIIDHNYDLIQDHRTRLNSIMEQLDRLAELDFATIYENTLSRRELNSRKFFANDFVRPYLQRLNSYLPDELECFKYTTCKDY